MTPSAPSVSLTAVSLSPSRAPPECRQANVIKLRSAALDATCSLWLTCRANITACGPLKVSYDTTGGIGEISAIFASFMYLLTEVSQHRSTLSVHRDVLWD